jgi:hypothetical protein
MTVMASLDALMTRTGGMSARQTMRPRHAAVPAPFPPWLLYPSLLAAALVTWFGVIEAGLTVYRLLFP